VSKADHEREVFLEFAHAAGLDVDRDSVQSEEPPRPDISCLVAGERRYFELTRAANQEIADEVGHLLTKARRTGETGAGEAHVYNDELTLRATVARKAASSHETGGAPLDLIVYYDGVFHPALSFESVESTFRELQAEYRGRWNAIWLYDRRTKQVLR
jgi:hypothetical protein